MVIDIYTALKAATFVAVDELREATSEDVVLAKPVFAEHLKNQAVRIYDCYAAGRDLVLLVRCYVIQLPQRCVDPREQARVIRTFPY